MPLYDVTRSRQKRKDELVDPYKFEHFDFWFNEIYKHGLGKDKLAEDCAAVDALIDRLVEDGTATHMIKVGPTGHLSVNRNPLKNSSLKAPLDSAHQIYSTEGKYGTEYLNIRTKRIEFVRRFFRWRISLQPETWLTLKTVVSRRSGRILPPSERGTTYHYWIDNTYAFPDAQEKAAQYVKKYA